MKGAKKKTSGSRSRSWHVSIIRKRGEFLGVIEAPSREAAEAAAVEKFNLSDWQRKKMVVQERD
jgi:hypothetical protein